MLEKIRDLADKDPLIFHKVGLVVGGTFGILLGLIISERADQYEVEVLEKEDGAEND